MFTESVGAKDVMLPRIGKFMHESSVWQTEEESSDSAAQSNKETDRCS